MPNDSKNKKESNYESFEYFDELVSSYDQLDKESDECLDKVQALLEDAFCAQKKSLELRKEQYKVFELIQEWLEKCGCRYDCNYDNDECEELSERVNSVIEDLVDEVVYLYQGETCFKGNLRQLKRKHPERILVLEDPIFDKEDEGVVSIQHIGNKYHVKLESEQIAYSYIKKLIKENNQAFSLEMVSLQMMIKEALYERTHSILS